jgi:hypothetical protein
VRCRRCGSANSEGNRFCGMCGASMLEKVPTPRQATQEAVPPVEKAAERKDAPAPASVAAERHVPARSAAEAAPVPAPPVSPPPTNPSPIIAGPSFLGLNKQGFNQAGDGRSGDQTGAYSEHRSSPDPLGRSSGNLDYLLEDEEEPKRGWGKLALVLIALALVGAFGYLRWKQGGFDFLKAEDHKPAATTQTADSPQAAPDSGASNASPSPASAPTAASGTTANPSAADSSAPAATPLGAAPATPPTAAAQNPPAEAGTSTQAPDSSPSNAAPAADSATPPAETDSASQAPVAEAPAAPKARTPKPTPAKPLDATTEAEGYIYGRGVRQDCDRGLRMLKPAAEQSNPKAMIALGALYSSGTCTPRDLPTAYRWFALALHKQPDNQPLQDDLQKLWSQMTQPERQLAIKLSQ